jgi:hypothetical protein
LHAWLEIIVPKRKINKQIDYQAKWPKNFAALFKLIQQPLPSEQGLFYVPNKPDSI